MAPVHNLKIERQQRLNAENVIEQSDKSARFKELYGDALARNVRKKHLQNQIGDTECTFKPTLVSR